MERLPEFERWECIETEYENEYEWQRGEYTVDCIRIKDEWIVTGLEPMACGDGEVIIDDKFQRDGISHIEAVPDAIRAVIQSMNEELYFQE